MLAEVTSQQVPGKTGMRCMARIVGAGSAPITRATLASVSVTLTDLTLEAQAKGTGLIATHNPSVSAVISDALNHADLAWTMDSALDPGRDGLWGFNLDYTIPAADFANSGDNFQADFVFTPVAGEPFRVVYLIPTLGVFA